MQFCADAGKAAPRTVIIIVVMVSIMNDSKLNINIEIILLIICSNCSRCCSNSSNNTSNNERSNNNRHNSDNFSISTRQFENEGVQPSLDSESIELGSGMKRDFGVASPSCAPNLWILVDSRRNRLKSPRRKTAHGRPRAVRTL